MPTNQPNPDKYELIAVENLTEFTDFLKKFIAYPDQQAEEALLKKSHFKYFINYLYKDPNGLNAKTILLEKTYISASYLGDYINYYAHCYRSYKRRCKRIHFFSEPITDAEFTDMLLNEQAHEKKWKSYLGYIVIKPLPKGIIGATLLQPYKTKSKRYFTVVREYSVNLFGKSLKITSLLYQEQDGIVGSCASSALWFAFQRTAALFQSPAPNPSDITLLAGHDSYQTGKNFPSSALEIRQICTAISAVGLISELRNDSYVTDTKWIKSFSYAYLRMGTPVLMGIDIEEIGNHLITLTGYRFQSGERSAESSSLIRLDLLSDDIYKFYAHDDQTGPFSKVDFINKPKDDYNLRTSWWKETGSDEVSKAKAICLIAPVQKNIRINFENILEEAVILDFDFNLRLGMNFTWDIFLSDSNGYKEEIRLELSKHADIYPEQAGDILFQSLPQFIWVARALVKYGSKNYRIFDLIYDAIDVNYEKTPYCSHIYNESFQNSLDEVMMSDEFSVFRPKSNDDDEEYPEDFYQLLSKDHSLVSAMEKLYDKLPEEGKSIQNVQTEAESAKEMDQVQDTAEKRVYPNTTDSFHEDLKKQRKNKKKIDPPAED